MTAYLIRECRPLGGEPVDIRIDGGAITAIGTDLPAGGAEVIDAADIKPQLVTVECHPYHAQRDLRAYLTPYGTVIEAWYPLGHGDKGLQAEPVFTELAEKYGKSPAQIILRWHLQEGNVTFPKTLNPAHMAENIDIFDFELTADEMARVNSLPQHSYYTVPEEAPAFVLAQGDYRNQA